MFAEFDAKKTLVFYPPLYPVFIFFFIWYKASRKFENIILNILETGKVHKKEPILHIFGIPT